jgi:hypothetical protein
MHTSLAFGRWIVIAWRQHRHPIIGRWALLCVVQVESQPRLQNTKSNLLHLRCTIIDRQYLRSLQPGICSHPKTSTRFLIRDAATSLNCHPLVNTDRPLPRLLQTQIKYHNTSSQKRVCFSGISARAKSRPINPGDRLHGLYKYYGSPGQDVCTLPAGRPRNS